MTDGLESLHGARADARPDDASKKLYGDACWSPAEYDRHHKSRGKDTDLPRKDRKEHHSAGKDQHVPSLIIDHGHPMKGRRIDHWRSELEESAHKKLSAEEMKRMDKAIDTFEKRAMKEHLSQEQVTQFYIHAQRILSGRETNHVASPEAKKILALQMLEQAAQPDRITQGNHNTCNVACAEHRIYSRRPEEAARLIADQVLTGTYTTKDGFTLLPNRVSMKPEFGTLHPPDQMTRSYASQVFQVTAVNVYWQKAASQIEGNEGTVRYVQNDAGKLGKYEGKTGEALTSYADGRKVLGRTPDLTDEKVGCVYNQIAGTKDTKFVVANRHPNGDGVELAGSDVMTTFNNPQEFALTLKDLKTRGQLPAILTVFAQTAPFNPGSNRSGWHVVNITSYDSSTGHVKIHNPWGQNTDVTMSYKDLYLHTQSR